MKMNLSLIFLIILSLLSFTLEQTKSKAKCGVQYSQCIGKCIKLSSNAQVKKCSAKCFKTLEKCLLEKKK